MNKKTVALDVKNLTVELGKKKIINNLTFKVNKGETLVVLGPNGAGKTTLLKAILDLIPHKGTVEWKVRNISYLPPKDLMQKKEILPLTVEDFYSLKEISKQKAIESLKSVGLLESDLKKRIAHLSTGQFQRLSIGWALVDDPDTLLFDEPTLGIDVGGTETIYSLLHEFWKKHKLTIILVTHDLNIVWEHADDVLCLSKDYICYGAPMKALTTENLKQLYGVGIKYYHHKKHDK